MVVEDRLERGLTADERAVLERFVAALEERHGPRLHAVWLFGSRARGETDRNPDSDVDVLVIVDDVSWEAKDKIRDVVYEVAHQLRLDAVAWSFSVHVETPAWLSQRREIRSFFIGEVDRDKIVLSGSA